MRPDSFIPAMQRRVATVAIGPSTLRNQGKGVISSTQDFLAQMSLAQIPLSGDESFREWLDYQTKALLNALPIKNHPWGTARKAINIFLRDAFYNRYLTRRFDLQRLEFWLEIPLDSAVAKGLRHRVGCDAIPSWPGLKHLRKDISDEYQAVASELAHHKGIARVHLDMYLWLENR